MHHRTMVNGAAGRFLSILDESVPYLLGIFLLINPVPRVTAVKEICFYSAAIAAILSWAAGKREYLLKTPLTWYFGFFFIWSLLTVFFALNKENSIHDLYAHLLKYLVIYFLIVNYFNSERRLNLLTWIAIASAALFSMGGMLYIYGYLHVGRNLSEVFYTRFGHGFYEIHINTVGVVIIPGLLLAFLKISEKRALLQKVFLSCCILSMFAALILTQSRSTILALMISAIVMLYRKWKILLIFVIALAMGIGFSHTRNRFAFDKIFQTDRLTISYTFFEIIKDYPIAGIGFGLESYADDKLLDKYNARTPERYRQPVPHKAPHNFILDLTTRVGLVGLILFFAILAKFIQMALWTMKQPGESGLSLCLIAVFTAVFTQGMFESILSGPPAVMLFLLFALMTIHTGLIREKLSSGSAGTLKPCSQTSHI